MRRSTATTEYLKECMGTALLELMQTKPIEKISIEEMTAKADVGRSTYFRYFKSKDEVLSFKIHCLWKRFCEAQARPADGPQDDTRMFFQFSLSLRPINDLLYAAGHQNALLEAYMQILDPSCQQSNIKTYYLNNFLAYGVFGLVNAWILRGYQETPEEMERVIQGWMEKNQPEQDET